MTGPDEARRADLDRLAAEEFDLLVVGGGITGAGVARDAALRGLRVALLEKGDFGAGTSSKSSKLVHGGLRYLEHGELRLVFEAVSERSLLMERLAPHLVRPLAFIAPVYQESRPGLFLLDIGLWIYDGLSRFRSPRLHRTYRAGALCRLEPQLRAEGLCGGIVYYDAITDDCRLVLENALDAAALGAVCLSYVAATGFLRHGGAVTGVAARDLETGREVEARARQVVVAAGPWADRVLDLPGAPARAGARLLRPTKGVHLVVDAARVPLQHAVAARSPQDQRVFFLIPWGRRVVIGTTDTDFSGSPDEVTADAADVRYLLEAANHYAPAAALVPDDVLATWAGLRPLVAPEGGGPRHASDVSREHSLLVPLPGLLVIAGGKLTTYRRMAAQVVDRALAEAGRSAAPSSTATRPLPGGDGALPDLAARGVPPGVAARLHRVYGARAAALLEAEPGADPLRPIDGELAAIEGEVRYAVRVERARTLADVLTRRTLLALQARDQALGVAPRVAELCGEALGWDAARRALELARYRELIAQSRAWRAAAPLERAGERAGARSE